MSSTDTVGSEGDPIGEMNTLDGDEWIIYDRENAEAWVQSDCFVNPAEVR